MAEVKRDEKQGANLKLGANWNNLLGRIKQDFPNINNSDLQFMSRGENELIGRLRAMIQSLVICFRS